MSFPLKFPRSATERLIVPLKWQCWWILTRRWGKTGSSRDVGGCLGVSQVDLTKPLDVEPVRYPGTGGPSRRSLYLILFTQGSTRLTPG